jgi:hypothetical protein
MTFPKLFASRWLNLAIESFVSSTWLHSMTLVLSEKTAAVWAFGFTNARPCTLKSKSRNRGM